MLRCLLLLLLLLSLLLLLLLLLLLSFLLLLLRCLHYAISGLQGDISFHHFLALKCLVCLGFTLLRAVT